MKKLSIALAAFLSTVGAKAELGTYSALSDSVVQGFALYMNASDPVTLKRIPIPNDFYAIKSPIGTPITHADFASGALVPLTATKARVCLRFIPLPTSRWKSALNELTFKGWSFSDSTDCANVTPQSPPQKFPAPLTAYRILDTEKSPLSTSVAPFPLVTPPHGSLLRAVTLPSVTTLAPPGGVSGMVYFKITNTNTPPDAALLNDPRTAPAYYAQWAQLSTKLTDISMPEPFVVAHSCTTIGPREECLIGVAFDATGARAGARVQSAITFAFDDKHYSRIGVMAIVTPTAGTIPPAEELALNTAYCDPYILTVQRTSCREEPLIAQPNPVTPEPLLRPGDGAIVPNPDETGSGDTGTNTPS